MIRAVVLWFAAAAFVRAPSLTETWVKDFNPPFAVSDDAEINDAMEEVLQQTVAQWSFVEAQLLEPNVKITMPEIAAPLQHLCGSLEVLANFHFVSGKPDKAVGILERACPLMELLPPDLDQNDYGRMAGELCFTILRELYNRHRSELDWFRKHTGERKQGEPAEDVERRIRQLRAPFDHLRHKAREFADEDNLLHPYPDVRAIDKLAREYFFAGETGRVVIFEESMAIVEKLRKRAKEKRVGSEAEDEALEAVFTALAYVRIMEAIEEKGFDAIVEELRDIRARIGLDTLDEYLVRQGKPLTPGLVDDAESLHISTYDLNMLVLRTYILFAFSTELQTRDDPRIPWGDLLHHELRITADLLWLLEGGFATKLVNVDVEIASASVLMNPFTFDGLAQNLLDGNALDVGLLDPSILDGGFRPPRDDYPGADLDLEQAWPAFGESGYFPRPTGRVSIACILFGVLVTVACVVQALFCPGRTQIAAVSKQHERLRIRGRRPKQKARPKVRLRDRNKAKAIPTASTSTSQSSSRGWDSDGESEPDSDTDLSVLTPRPRLVQEGKQKPRPEPKQVSNRSQRRRSAEPEAERQQQEAPAAGMHDESNDHVIENHARVVGSEIHRRPRQQKSKSEPELTPEDANSDDVEGSVQASPAVSDGAGGQRSATARVEDGLSPKSPDLPSMSLTPSSSTSSSSRRRTRRAKKSQAGTPNGSYPNGEASPMPNAAAVQYGAGYRNGKHSSKKPASAGKAVQAERLRGKGRRHSKGRSLSVSSSVDASPSSAPAGFAAHDAGANHAFFGQLPPPQQANASSAYVQDYRRLHNAGLNAEHGRQAKAQWTAMTGATPVEVNGQEHQRPKTSSESTVEEEEAAALFADLDRGLDLLKLDNEPQPAEGASEPSTAPSPSLGGVHWTPLLDLGGNWDS